MLVLRQKFIHEIAVSNFGCHKNVWLLSLQSYKSKTRLSSQKYLADHDNEIYVILIIKFENSLSLCCEHPKSAMDASLVWSFILHHAVKIFQPLKTLNLIEILPGWNPRCVQGCKAPLQSLDVFQRCSPLIQRTWKMRTIIGVVSEMMSSENISASSLWNSSYIYTCTWNDRNVII